MSGLGSRPTASNHNPMKDFEVVQPPDDAVTCMEFSPASITQANYLICGSWDHNVRCWEIQSNGNSIPMQQQPMTSSVMDVAWSNVISFPSSIIILFNLIICWLNFKDGSKVFMAGCDNMAKCWDLPSNECIQVYECFLIASLSDSQDSV